MFLNQIFNKRKIVQISLHLTFNICRLPENSNLLHQLFVTDNGVLSVAGNSYSVIPQNLMFKKGTNKTRKEIMQELLSSDHRSRNQQVWTLALKKKKLVRQSQIVQSVTQDCQYVLSHLLPLCSLLAQGPKITYNYCL